MSSIKETQLIDFLQQELSIPQDSIAIAQRSMKKNLGPLPMVLWQYGLITIEQLDRLYDWLDQ